MTPKAFQKVYTKIDTITKAGIYIINGKKVLVK